MILQRSGHEWDDSRGILRRPDRQNIGNCVLRSPTQRHHRQEGDREDVEGMNLACANTQARGDPI
jgi:hypothetical protein